MEKNKVILADTRNQVDDFVVKELERLGYTVRRTTLPFGDFALMDNITHAVDIKSSSGGVIEVAKNICSSDHARLRREILKCAEWGGEICFLVANNDGITNIEQLKDWQSPCYKWNVKKDGVVVHRKGEPLTRVKGETLMKAIKTICEPNHYKQGLTVRFTFVAKEKAGAKIIQILEWWRNQKEKKWQDKKET